MDAVQGAVLGVKLKHLEQWTEKRRCLADRYLDAFRGCALELPSEAAGRRHVWRLFVALHPRRDRLREELQPRGIRTGLHHPIPLHLQEAYAHLGHRAGDFPVAERIARQCPSLPLFAEMTVREQHAVIEALAEISRQEL